MTNIAARRDEFDKDSGRFVVSLLIIEDQHVKVRVGVVVIHIYTKIEHESTSGWFLTFECHEYARKSYTMAPTIKWIPDGYHSVTPHLINENASRLIEFLQLAFEAEEMPDCRGQTDESCTLS